MAKEDLKNTIILDSGLSIELFRNTTLVTDINRSNQVRHIYKNVGSKINQMRVIVPDYGKLWYDDKSIVNILSLTIFFNKYRVAYESHKYCALNVCINRGIIKFRINKQGLYVFNTTYTRVNSNVITTVE